MAEQNKENMKEQGEGRGKVLSQEQIVEKVRSMVQQLSDEERSVFISIVENDMDRVLGLARMYNALPDESKQAVLAD